MLNILYYSTKILMIIFLMIVSLELIEEAIKLIKLIIEGVCNE